MKKIIRFCFYYIFVFPIKFFPKNIEFYGQYCKFSIYLFDFATLIISKTYLPLKKLLKIGGNNKGNPLAILKKFQNTTNAPARYLTDFTKNYEIAIRFSGGSDSTLLAAQMILKFKKVHLITFNTSLLCGILDFTHSSPQKAKEMYYKLVKKYGSKKFIFKIIDIINLRQKIYYGDYLPKTKSIPEKLFICPSCIFAQHIKMIKYCLDKNIKFVSDGSNTEYFSQNIQSVKEIQKMYSSFNIKYIINPNYHVLNSDEILFKYNIIERLNKKDIKNPDYLSTQQTCFFSQFFHRMGTIYYPTYDAFIEQIPPSFFSYYFDDIYELLQK